MILGIAFFVRGTMATDDNNSEHGIQKEAWHPRHASDSTDDHEEDLNRITRPVSNRPGRLAIAMRLIGMVVAIYLAVNIVATLREFGRDSHLNEAGKFFLVFGSACIGVPIFILGVAWTIQAIRQKTQTAPVHMAKYLTGLTLFVAA